MTDADQDLEATVARLERRVERERTARREAEQIAERGLRDLFLANQQLDQKVRDRTAEVEAERSAAQNAARARSEFLRVLSREIRSPLNGVLGMIELLDGHVRTEQERLWTASAKVSVDQLHHLVTRLLLFVDVDGPNQQPPSAFGIADLLDDVRTEWERKLLGNGLLLFVENGAADATFVGYHEDIRRILDELLDNVNKHADPGSVAVSATIDGGDLTIEVRDSGPGFAGADQMFNLNERGSEHEDLRGIGYSLVRRMANRSNTWASISSAPGEATIVTLTISQSEAPAKR